jgi:hypothetical protein
MTALESNTITDGEREIIESEFIAKIAAETGVDTETMRTIRAL